MELRTLEIRWFRTGPCPDEVRAWFHSVPAAGEPEQRIDRYLALPDRDDIGVKQRGGSVLDIKLLVGAPAGPPLPDGFDGRVEEWVKWSFPLDAGGLEAPEGSWIAVYKRRWARVYEVAEGRARAVSPAGDVSNGCAAELVEIEVDGRGAWGFGFEAFGTDPAAGAVLVSAVTAFVTDTPLVGVAFPASDSFSYPAWLVRWPRRA